MGVAYLEEELFSTMAGLDCNVLSCVYICTHIDLSIVHAGICAYAFHTAAVCDTIQPVVQARTSEAISKHTVEIEMMVSIMVSCIRGSGAKGTGTRTRQDRDRRGGGVTCTCASGQSHRMICVKICY